jgi:hypothetical protein
MTRIAGAALHEALAGAALHEAFVVTDGRAIADPAAALVAHVEMPVSAWLIMCMALSIHAHA